MSRFDTEKSPNLEGPDLRLPSLSICEDKVWICVAIPITTKRFEPVYPLHSPGSNLWSNLFATRPLDVSWFQTLNIPIARTKQLPRDFPLTTAEFNSYLFQLTINLRSLNEKNFTFWFHYLCGMSQSFFLCFGDITLFFTFPFKMKKRIKCHFISFNIVLINDPFPSI